MNAKRFILAVVAVYVVAQLLNYLIHQVWLAPTYGSLASVWRPEADMLSKMWLLFVTSAFFCVFFVYIFVRGYQNRGIGEGLRYGLVIGLFYSLPQAYEAYVIYPIPYYLALQWFLSKLVVSVILRVVAALIYKPATAAG